MRDAWFRNPENRCPTYKSQHDAIAPLLSNWQHQPCLSILHGTNKKLTNNRTKKRKLKSGKKSGKQSRVKDCLWWLHFAGFFLHSVPLPILEVTQPRFWRITVHWIWGVSSSQSESLIDGTAYHSMWLTLQASMRSGMVSILWEEIRWASSWTDWSVWPYGLTCFWGSSGTGAAAPGKLPGKLIRGGSPECCMIGFHEQSTRSAAYQCLSDKREKFWRVP